MAENDKLPAKMESRSVVDAGSPAGNLLSRGLEAIRNAPAPSLEFPSDEELEARYYEVFERGDYGACLAVIRMLEKKGSQRASALRDDYLENCIPSCLSYGDDDYELAERAREEMWSCLERAAECHDSLAQDMLSDLYCYQDGGVSFDNPSNYPDAVKWTRRAAEQGRMSSQSHLGSFYFYGLKGIPVDTAEAARWFKSAADRGCNYSQEKLANMYFTGDGVRQDYTKAHHYYMLVAENSHVSSAEDALAKLAEIYENGLGVGRDYVTAYMFRYVFRLWSRFNEGLDRALAALAAKMTPDQVAEAQRCARDWYARHRT